MKNRIHVFLFLFILSGFYACNTPSGKTQNEQQVFEWRGEDRKGIYHETGLLKQWPEEGPELVWEYEGIGNGYGSPVFTDKGMYILGEIDSLAYLFAFDADGNLSWKKDFGKEWVKSYPGSRSAPTVVGKFVYVTTGLGVLACFNRETGEKMWSVDMVNDLNGKVPMHGISESVIIEHDKVFCTPGGKDTNVVALNRFSGDIIWISKGKGERPGYNSPQIVQLENIHILVHFSAYHLMGHHTETGELLWAHEQDNLEPEERKPGWGDTHSNTILYEDGYIYYAAGDGNGGVKLELAIDGSSVKEVWRNKDFDSYMGGIVKLGDYLYGCGTAKKDFKSIHAQTGEIADSLKIGSGAVIAADNMLYYYNWKGEVMLITSDPENLEVISSFRMKKGKKEHFAHPVIHDGKLYIRHGNYIQAFDIKEKNMD